jgi:hypothetical protein
MQWRNDSTLWEGTNNALRCESVDPPMSQLGLGRVKTLCEKGKVGRLGHSVLDLTKP